MRPRSVRRNRLSHGADQARNVLVTTVAISMTIPVARSGYDEWSRGGCGRARCCNTERRSEGAHVVLELRSHGRRNGRGRDTVDNRRHRLLQVTFDGDEIGVRVIDERLIREL